MATVTAFNKQNWPIGTRTFEAAVPIGISSAKFMIDRSSLSGPPTQNDVIHFHLWISQDSGASWADVGGAGFSDGVIDAPNGCGVMLQVPNPGNANRRARLELTTTKVLNLAVTLETL